MSKHYLDRPEDYNHHPGIMIKFYEYMKKLEHVKEYNLYNSWGLRTRPKIEEPELFEYEENSELTESDDEGRPPVGDHRSI